MGDADRDTSRGCGWARLDGAGGVVTDHFGDGSYVWWETLLENRRFGQKTQVQHSVNQRRTVGFGFFVKGERKMLEKEE